ncbi:MAG: HAMP domain-containing histidine kinase [Roseburia sp.]|nr:HAMP domain-containing histidine kinase [Roseburia sp.]
MKSIPKLIRRFLGILMISFILIFILNIVLLVVSTIDRTASGGPYTLANEIGAALKKNEEGYELDQTSLETLEKENIWAICIDDATHQVVWRTKNTPDTIPQSYSLSDISNLTMGYIQDCATYAGAADGGLVVLGYPPYRYWKHLWPTWDWTFIANLPKTVLFGITANIMLILLIYVIANSGLLRAVKPIVTGIQALPTGEYFHVKENGLLSELAMNINQTSDILLSQRHQLRKKETARANWIAGVSHDIRTPLSMAMGYASQLMEDASLSDGQRQKAASIVKQSQRIKNLINDLNLASKLEYNMQPINTARQNMAAIVRQAAADFINMGFPDKYQIEWITDETFTHCPVNADKDLIKRAVSNLIQNSISHNEAGCNIYVSLRQSEKECIICVEDNGVGVSDKQIESLNNTPHYMVCDTNTTEQRHGLGLLIVKQIALSHGGCVRIKRSIYGGLGVEIVVPMCP